jgi:hypothetical protein
MRMVAASQDDRSQERPWSHDPLLATLCGQNCSSEGAKIIYEEIEAGELAGHYDPHTEFPFFGSRLIELQELVKHHQPQNVRSLFADKTDVAAWYTLWSNQVSLPFFNCNQLSALLNFRLASCFLRNIHHISHDCGLNFSSLASDPS